LARQIFAGLQLVTFLPVSSTAFAAANRAGVWPQPAPHGLRPSTSAKPRTLSGLSVLQVLRYHYKFAMKSQDVFIFFWSRIRAFELFALTAVQLLRVERTLQGMPSLISRRGLTLSRAF
jgi:hypothetical protein